MNMKCELCHQPIKKLRTVSQNSALHLYFHLLAEALNDAGYDIRTTIREEIEIPWTKETVKQYLWKPVMDRYAQQQSTTKMSTRDIDQIYDIVNRFVGERTGVFIPFPSEYETKNS